MADNDPYARLIPGRNTGGPDAAPQMTPQAAGSDSGDDPYARLMPGRSAAPAGPQPEYEELVPERLDPALGGYPSVSNYISESGKAFIRGVSEVAAGQLRGGAEMRIAGAQDRLEALQAPPGATPDELAYADPFERAAARTRQSVLHPTPQVTQERIQAITPVAQTPVAEHPLYRAGQAVTQNITESPTFKSTGILNPVVEDVFQGLGSLAGNLVQAAVPVVGPATLAVGSPLQGADEAYQRAIRSGVDSKTALRAAQQGTVAGATEFGDALILMSGSTGRAAGLLAKLGRKAVEGAFIEGGQEGLQQLIQNAVAKGLYKPDQDLKEDVAYNVFIGGIVGGAARTITPTGGRGTAPTQQDIDRAFSGLTEGPQTPPETSPAAVPPSGPEAPPAGAQSPGSQPAGAPTVPGEPVPGEYTGQLGPEPPPAEPPPMGTKAAGAATRDLGFGYKIITRADDFALVDDQGKVLDTDVNFSDLEQRGLQFLDEGEGALSGSPTEVSGARRIPIGTGGTTAPSTPAAPPVQAPPGTTIEPGVIDFINKKVPPLSASESTRSNAAGELEAMAPSKQEIIAKPGVNLGRMAKLLGPKLYGSPEDIGSVTVKELFQNSFDAIKGMLDKGIITSGKIDVVTNPTRRSIAIVDNGGGMSPHTLGTTFLEIAGSEKEGKASGGFGIAKMLFLFGNKQLKVLTMKDGQVSRMTATGKQLFDAMNDPSQAPRVHTNRATPAERDLFPYGHGTAIEVIIPETYDDPGTGSKKQIYFPSGRFDHEVLTRSPLFRGIDVTFNGEPMTIGSKFPISDYTKYADFKFKWGTAKLYLSKEKRRGYGANYHVLSNGLWQFSQNLRINPGEWGSELIPYTFYLDITPNVKPEDHDYPFDLNRQGFSKAVSGDFDQIINYVALTFQTEQFKEAAVNYGDMSYLAPSGNKVKQSPPLQLKFKKPTQDTPVTAIKPGDKVEVVDGELIVNNRKAPVITPQDMASMSIDFSALQVDQSQINPDQVMLHDNTVVEISEVEKKSVSTLGREKFGQRFDDFIYDIGQLFIELRDQVVKVMGSDYNSLKKEAIGVSFDTEYRGVSIRVPFAGSFINPAVPEYNDVLRAGVGVVGTMVHELAHHKVRSHNADFPAEMQRLWINLMTDRSFDYHGFNQRVVTTFAKSQDIFTYINGLFSGVHRISPRGSRFKDASAGEIRSGSVIESILETGNPTEGRAQLYQSTLGSDQLAPQSQQRGRAGLTVESQGNVTNSASRSESVLSAESRDSQVVGAPPQDEMSPQKMALRNIFAGSTAPPPAVTAMGPHADRMNWLYKWAYGLDRLVDANPAFTPLLRYAERVREMRLDTARIHDAGLRIAKAWRRLGTQAENLSALIDDVSNMVYRSPAEKARGIARHPTAAEFSALVTQHQVSAQALSVFNRQKKFFEIFLDLVTQNARDHATRIITDPVALSNKLNAINARNTSLKSRPYFPFMRFGLHYVEVRNAAGKVIHFETFERKGLQSAERQQTSRKRQLERAKAPTDTVKVGVLPETVAPFIGLPPELLEAIQRELGLTGPQKDAMEQLRFELSPAASFAHRFQHKNYVPGYSHDFLRSFSRYAFNGARYYARTKYAWALQQEISNAGNITGNKEGAIANYMRDHFQNTILDAKGDFGVFKGAIFLWVFGYSVAGAFVNLSQVPMITFPWMAAKFGGIGKGDALVSAELAKQTLKLKNFYTKGKYDTTPGVPAEFEQRAMEYGIKSGRISESFASELAGLAQGQNLLGMGNSRSGRNFQVVMEKASWMFEMAEQFNRRVTYMSALALSMRYPNSQATKEALNKYADEYTTLQTAGFSPAEASAIVTAVHATEQTQFVYSRDTRPRFMRGRLAGTIFVFKTYMLNVLQLMGANKTSVFPRYFIMMLMLAGLMGLPGAEDMTDIADILGRWWFGKDFDTKLALREFILEFSNGSVPPDIVLHGLARRGFGLPAIVDLIGEKPGRGLRPIPGQNVPFPTVDMSKSVGMGRILPFELGKMVDPGKDVDKAIATSTQQASGAIFGVGFNLYRALQDTKSEASDWKRWERAMPRALGSASRAYRAFNEGRERGAGRPDSASTIVPYDRRDTEQMTEILALGLGFMPLRQSGKWDQIIAQSTILNKFKLEKDILFQQMFEAQIGRNKEEIDSVAKAMREYNQNLPKWAKSQSITGDQIEQSMQTRARNRAAQESGVPAQTSAIPIARHIQSLFPESTVDVRRVPNSQR